MTTVGYTQNDMRVPLFWRTPLVEVVFHLWRFIENTHAYIRAYTIVCNYICDSTLRITGPCYRGVWMCIAGVWDLQTTSFEIPGSLAYIIHLFFRIRMYATKRITTFCNAKPSNWSIINTYRTPCSKIFDTRFFSGKKGNKGFTKNDISGKTVQSKTMQHIWYI